MSQGEETATILLPGPRPKQAAGTDALRRGSAWFRSRFLEPERPLVAVEIRARSVGIVRVRRARGKLDLAAATQVDLPEGTLALSVTQPNVIDPAQLRVALRAALERAGILDGAKAALILPDAIARVTFLPTSDIKGKRPAEVLEILRFKLKKTVPFDVREARVAHVATGARGEDRVIVAAAFAPVLAAYEDACVDVGIQPGLVQLAGLTLAERAFPKDAAGDRLLVNWDEGYLSVIVVRDGWPVLVRTLPDSASALPDVVREVTHTTLYHRERLGGGAFAEVAVRSAVVPPLEVAEALQPVVGVMPFAFDPWRALGGAVPPDVAQSLAAAAAAVGLRP